MEAVGRKRRAAKDADDAEDAPGPVIKRRRHRDDEEDDKAAHKAEPSRPKKKDRERSKSKDGERKHHRTPEAEQALAYFAEMHKAEGGGGEAEGPDEYEREAIHAYGVELLKMRDKERRTKARTAPMKRAVVDLRKKMYEWMVSGGHEVVAIPKEMLEKHNAELDKCGLPPVPAYIRLFRNNKDGTILPETVHKALESVTAADVQEVLDAAKKPLGVTAALLLAVVNKVRDEKREYTQQVKLLDSLPRGVKAPSVEDADEEAATWAIQLHTNDQYAKKMDGERKAADTKREANLKLLVPLVASYFARSGLMTETGFASQQMVLGGVPYRLVRRVTTTKQPIRFGTINKALWEGLARAWRLEVPDELLGGGKEEDEDEEEAEGEDEPKRGRARGKKSPPPDPIKSMEALEILLTERRTALVEHVTGALSSLPPTRKVEIKLYDVAKPRIKAPADTA